MLKTQIKYYNKDILFFLLGGGGGEGFGGSFTPITFLVVPPLLAI